MPVSSFRVRLVVRGQQNLARLREKLRSFRPVWEAIAERWRSHNVDKFEQSRGQEGPGTLFDFNTIWKGLTSKYMAAKRRAGYEDWLMVRTGELRESLTVRDAFGWWEDLEPDRASFGTLLKKAAYHHDTRPVMFLDQHDLSMINSMFGAWLGDQPPFAAYEMGGAASMDREFASMFGRA